MFVCEVCECAFVYAVHCAGSVLFVYAKCVSVFFVYAKYVCGVCVCEVCVCVCEVCEVCECVCEVCVCAFVYAKCVFVSVFKVKISVIRSVNSRRKHDVSVNTDNGAGVCIIVWVCVFVIPTCFILGTRM